MTPFLVMRSNSPFCAYLYVGYKPTDPIVWMLEPDSDPLPPGIVLKNIGRRTGQLIGTPTGPTSHGVIINLKFCAMDTIDKHEEITPISMLVVTD